MMPNKVTVLNVKLNSLQVHYKQVSINMYGMFQIGAASRIPGITPAALVYLLQFVKKSRHLPAGKARPV